MEFPALTERTYNDSRRKLSVLAQAMALDVIHRAQSQAVTLILQAGLPDDAARLLKSDIAESLLAKDVARVVECEGYLQVPTAARREEILEQALVGTLLGWVSQKVEQEDAHRLLQAVLSLYEPSNPDGRP
ncbi:MULTISPECIES: hypothetical protein [unclassified Variovorax]|uniref:hypothetical protein n=1 Tax=unclassified Variovorax TaxID=663243 RepID=UPI00076C638E|nr:MULTISPECIES: hypothetical protein [unclassified Variovorax]KWT98486.1 hypothetical protein APY03_0621 [Variovorax sp. WDL1]PNG49839.1 hypothetical protein CHC06_05420 [Variovorax sp. B2]PNG50711.1 hypothetical protein CHC07_05325 [Variovorax sp. B4]VTU42387.1 hypothetical protein H6P1_00173 [Variovorax sp. PBL-H6]VTU43991.1 hypothetical protein SRS16P1_00729 [Variovorax sp. SRS16]